MKKSQKIFSTIIIVVIKSIGTLILLALLAFFGTSFSPIYNFHQPTPFSGPDIFNPYEKFDSTSTWKRANFHVHTRVKGILNECKYWPNEVYQKLAQFGYDIITFSNHNELTTHPFDSSLQVNVYEHGYNLFKYHKLVFGSKKVLSFDHLLPFLTSQKQFQLNLLGHDADIIQINHPLRTNFLTMSQLQKLSGYKLIELDSGKSTENKYWDYALSAGHYCFGLANDDLHYPDKSRCIAVRCNFLCTPSAHYEDIKQALLDGAYYALRIPDYGHGDWEMKYKMNKQLPYVNNIGLKDNTIYMSVSTQADSIKVIGQNHKTLALLQKSDNITYTMKSEDTYARITAYFPNGEVIYSNPFARYDKSTSNTPFKENCFSINYTLTILFNLALIILLIFSFIALYKLIFKI